MRNRKPGGTCRPLCGAGPFSPGLPDRHPYEIAVYRKRLQTKLGVPVGFVRMEKRKREACGESKGMEGSVESAKRDDVSNCPGQGRGLGVHAAEPLMDIVFHRMRPFRRDLEGGKEGP